MPGNAFKKCSKAGNLYVEVRRQGRDNPKAWEDLLQNCLVKVGGGDVDKPEDHIKNNTTFNNLCAGSYSLEIKPAGQEATFRITESVEEKGVELQKETDLGEGAVQRSTTIQDN